MWLALYCKRTSTQRDDGYVPGVNGDVYEEGDELRYLWGDNWPREAERLDIPVEP